MKGLEFLGLGANKLNTFHENTLPDNIVNGLKTLNLASNPYLCDCNLIWFIKWLNTHKNYYSRISGKLSLCDA
jgi:toll-like receptor 13